MPHLLRVAVVAVLAAVLAVVLFPGYLAIRAGDTKVIEPERFDFVLLALSAFWLTVGIQLVPWRRSRYIAALAVLTGAGLLFGVMGMLSIGLPFLAASLVLLLLLYRTLRRSPTPLSAPAAIGGAVIGYALVLLFIAQAVPPIVECFPNGGGTSSGRWYGSRAVNVGGGMRMGPDGAMTGTIEAPTWSATFRCERGHVVSFERVAR
ncbi:MAG: hypothetical protein ACRDF9_11630 [Candidatus Limnocylindria bacterium]